MRTFYKDKNTEKKLEVKSDLETSIMFLLAIV